MPAPKLVRLRAVPRLIFSLGVAALLLAGCAHQPPPPTRPDGSPAPVSRSTVPYEVGALDRAEIDFADGRREIVEVDQSGRIFLPEEELFVRGWSKARFVAVVRRAFPTAVKIEVIEFYPDEITILGEVFHQIHTSMGGTPMRVMDGIAAANGFTPLANKRRVKLIRQNAGEVEVYHLDLREMLRGENLSQNLLLRPGDVITVPRNFL